jgi:hypothetical protein
LISPPPTRYFAKVLFDYEAVEENELSLKAGETIQDIDMSYDTWWYGANEHDEYGYFPGSFVEILGELQNSTNYSYGDKAYETIHQRESAESTFAVHPDGLTGRALYDYDAAGESEIGFKEGDIISGIETIDEGWWRGYDSAGNVGLFPASYLELIDPSTAV